MNDKPDAPKPRPVGVIAAESNRLAEEVEKRKALGLPVDGPSPFDGFRSGVEPVGFASGFRSSEATGFASGFRSDQPSLFERLQSPKDGVARVPGLPNTLTYKMQQQEERVRREAAEMQRAHELSRFVPIPIPKRRKSNRRMTLERAALLATVIGLPVAIIIGILSFVF